MHDIPQIFDSVFALIIALIALIWIIIWFLVPFYIYSINKKMKLLTDYYLQKDGKKINWRGQITSL